MDHPKAIAGAGGTAGRANPVYGDSPIRAVCPLADLHRGSGSGRAVPVPAESGIAVGNTLPGALPFESRSALARTGWCG